MTPMRSVSTAFISALLCTGAWAQPRSTSITMKPQVSLSLHGKYGFHFAAGVLPTTSSSVRCDTVCERISDYDSFFDVVRLSGGGFAALRRGDDRSLSWQVSENLSEVSRGVLEKWPSNKREPRSIPAIAKFVISHAVPLKESTDIFVGVWKPDEQAQGPRLFALFSDRESQRIERFDVTGACVIASVEAPVLAVSSQSRLHGTMWPVQVIIRRPQADQAGILGFMLFPDSIECQDALTPAE